MMMVMMMKILIIIMIIIITIIIIVVVIITIIIMVIIINSLFQLGGFSAGITTVPNVKSNLLFLYVYVILVYVIFCITL